MTVLPTKQGEDIAKRNPMREMGNASNLGVDTPTIFLNVLM